jgi:hypothetical protein
VKYNTSAQRVDSLKLSAVSTFNLFREPSYISGLGGFGNIEPLIFEADIIPYYMLSLNRNTRWGIELSPRIILRMYNKDSYPVRTPSFMPRITVFYQIIDNNSNKRDWFSYFSWYHHSNGQDGSFYNPDSITINTLSGNFSTNFIEAGAFLSRPDKRRPYILNYMKFSVSFCYQQCQELSPAYGRLRLSFDYQTAINLSKVVRIISSKDQFAHHAVLTQSVHLGCISGRFCNTREFDNKRFIFKYTLSYKPKFLNDVTFFAQYYYGQDYYNIYFNRTLKILRFGISAKTSLFN